MPPWRYIGSENLEEPYVRSEFGDEYVKWINNGEGIAIVSKAAGSNIISEGIDWHPNARIAGVDVAPEGMPHRYVYLRTIPNQEVVPRPTREETDALLTEGRAIGQFKNAIIRKASDFLGTCEATGAISIWDVDRKLQAKDTLYYIPAAVVPGKLSEQFDLGAPHYITLNKGEMPTYYFFPMRLAVPSGNPAPKQVAPPKQIAATTTETLPHHAIRSGAPTPEPVRAPTSPETSKSLAVNTKKAEEESKAKSRVQRTYEVFNEEEEQDPLEFLEYYNEKFNGWLGIRSKMMIREEDIDRQAYKTPCLGHTHKDFKDLKAAPAAFKELPPIADDDPSVIRFKEKLVRRTQIRDANIHPKPVFVTEYCRHPQHELDPKKFTLTRDLYMKYWNRAKLAEAEIEARSTCCRACGLSWENTSETPRDHYRKHREEYNLWLEDVHPSKPLLEPVLSAKKMAPPDKGVPTLNWFRALEKIILNNENEILEREEVCRVCDEAIDYGFASPQEHYAEHVEQRNALRALYGVASPAETVKRGPALKDLTIKDTWEAGHDKTRADSRSSLSTSPSRTFTPLRDNHPSVKRHDEQTKRRKRFTGTPSRFGSSFQPGGPKDRTHETRFEKVTGLSAFPSAPIGLEESRTVIEVSSNEDEPNYDDISEAETMELDGDSIIAISTDTAKEKARKVMDDSNERKRDLEKYTIPEEESKGLDGDARDTREEAVNKLTEMKEFWKALITSRGGAESESTLKAFLDGMDKMITDLGDLKTGFEGETKSAIQSKADTKPEVESEKPDEDKALTKHPEDTYPTPHSTPHREAGRKRRYMEDMDHVYSPATPLSSEVPRDLPRKTYKKLRTTDDYSDLEELPDIPLTSVQRKITSTKTVTPTAGKPAQESPKKKQVTFQDAGYAEKKQPKKKTRRVGNKNKRSKTDTDTVNKDKVKKTKKPIKAPERVLENEPDEELKIIDLDPMSPEFLPDDPFVHTRIFPSIFLPDVPQICVSEPLVEKLENSQPNEESEESEIEVNINVESPRRSKRKAAQGEKLYNGQQKIMT